jgi:hypothetical protein
MDFQNTVFHVKHRHAAMNEIVKLIQSLGKLIYTNRWKIRKNMPFSLSFLIPRN